MISYDLAHLLHQLPNVVEYNKTYLHVRDFLAPASIEMMYRTRYHHVESHAPPGQLNVAVNVWFDAEPSGATPANLHRILRNRLRVDCASSE